METSSNNKNKIVHDLRVTLDLFVGKTRLRLKRDIVR